MSLTWYCCAPTAIRAGHLVTRHKRVDGVLLLAYNAARLQLIMYPLIDLGARTVVRRNHECVFRSLGILARDSRDAFLVALYLMDSTLPIKTFDSGSNLTVRQLLDGFLQFRVALPHDLSSLTVRIPAS